ncbi:F-box protein [Melia azedarach]|uniref:F-box protein n=1 Tax=Melia azedarach TaxID=155640 RepID=A0ACC1Z1F0_MELAZ|nr:F-box protein [Melia azedarach]
MTLGTSPLHVQSFSNERYYVAEVVLQKLTISLIPSAVEAIENDDLLQEILSRLPAQSVFKFKRVAKRWQHLISEPRFSELWKPKCIAGLFFVTNWYSHYPTYNFMPLDNEIKATKMLHFKCLTANENPCGISIVQSCNGLLLCCSNYHNRRDSTCCNYYVYNPTTNKMRTLPRLQNSERKMTAETGTWRLSGDPFSFDNLILHDGVYWSGKIVWLNLQTETFFSFDVDKEEYGEMLLPKPPIEDEWRHYKIKYFNEWRGNLNLIRYSNTGKMQIYIFQLKEEQSEWIIKHHIDGDKLMRNNAHLFGNQDRYFLCILSLVHGEDSYLVLYIPGHVVAYHFRNKKIRKLSDLTLDLDDQHALSTLGWTDVHQYIQTFSHV